MSKTHEKGDVSMVTSGPFLQVNSDGQGKVKKKVNNRLHRYDWLSLVTIGMIGYLWLHSVSSGFSRYKTKVKRCKDITADKAV